MYRLEQEDNSRESLSCLEAEPMLRIPVSSVSIVRLAAMFYDSFLLVIALESTGCCRVVYLQLNTDLHSKTNRKR